MTPYLTTYYGNAGSIHTLGVQSRIAVDKAREKVASLINAKPENIIFTSGGSEANNLAVNSCLNNLDFIEEYFLTSGTEHDSMIKAADGLFYNNIKLKLNYKDGSSLIEDINSSIKEYDVHAMSFMYVNNELGFVNPVCDIGDICKKKEILFISDCVQALGSEKIDVNQIGCDFMSLSSHKINGPKGVGALYVRDKELLLPIIHGGDNQEFGYRGGTENVAGIVGFGKACELIESTGIELIKFNIRKLRETFLDNLDFEYIENYPRLDSKIISLTIPGVDAETLVLMLSAKGVYISAGSACKSLESKPNHAIMYAGIPEELSRNTVRISLSIDNNFSEVKEAANILNKIVNAK